MIDGKKLWNNRSTAYMKEVQRYGRYILNPNLLLVSIILGSTAFVYYKQWVDTLPETFPSSVGVAIICGIILSSIHFRTLLKEPDKVFLLPAESQFKVPYFQQAFLFSFFISIYRVVFALIIIAPFFHNHFLAFTLFLFVIAIWNVFMDERFPTIFPNYISLSLRFICTTLATYIMLEHAWFLITVIIIIQGYAIHKTTPLLQWELLIERESKHMMSFYRLANLFTDVPQVKEKAKRRKYLDVFLSLISYKQENSFLYMYVRVFLRSGDYLWLFLRLLIIGAFFVYVIPVMIGKVIAALFFIYATAFQLFPLAKHHERHGMLALYPLQSVWKKQALFRLLFPLLMIESCVFSLVTWTNFQTAILIFGSSICFAYLYLKLYTRRGSNIE